MQRCAVQCLRFVCCAKTWPKTWQKRLSLARLCFKLKPKFSFCRPVPIQTVTGVSVVVPGGEFSFMERRPQGCTLEFPRRRERLALHQLWQVLVINPEPEYLGQYERTVQSHNSEMRDYLEYIQKECWVSRFVVSTRQNRRRFGKKAERKL